MKVPPKRKGNSNRGRRARLHKLASMKVPPKRKGNTEIVFNKLKEFISLNESPSEKEGKFKRRDLITDYILMPQ